MFRPKRLKFGAFLAPYHPTDENPTVAFERDLELVEWMDKLSFDEVWVGEHHSAGWETIASPEIFLAIASERTRHIRLGTGVVCVPFHNPLMVANRIVLLDHLTRGRVQMATGPGLLMSDHHMLGLDPGRSRISWEEGLDTIMRLLTETEPITVKTEWFDLRDAYLQIRPYQQPHMPIVVAGGGSPAGVTFAGKYASGLLTFGVNVANPRGDNYKTRPLHELWEVVEETAANHNRTVSREGWRLAVPIYLADTREEALREARIAAGRWVKEYLGDTLGTQVIDVPLDEVLDVMVKEGHWIIGSVDDAIEAIENLFESSKGFGGLIALNLDWAPHHKVLHSYELLARYVMPRYQGSLDGVKTARQWHSERREELQKGMWAAITRAQEHFGRTGFVSGPQEASKR